MKKDQNPISLDNYCTDTMLTKGHKIHERGLSNLTTLLMQLCQLLLMFNPQLGHFLQLSFIPCAIMPWTGILEERFHKLEVDDF